MKTTKALWNKVGKLGLTLGAALATGAALAVGDLPGGPAVNQFSLHPAVTKIAAEQGWLNDFIMVICVVIFVGVFGTMFYSIFKHRKSKGHKAANFHESTTIEVAWTVVPFIIIIMMALPATRTMPSTCRPSASRKRRYRASSATPGFAPRRSAPTTANAPSSAARST